MATLSRKTTGLAFACFLLVMISVVSSVYSDDRAIFEPALLGIGTGLACELAKCLRGQCVNSTSFPFYKCECNEGWKSPFGASWLPCILPNCSIDLSCSNSSNPSSAPPPVVPPFGGVFDICSLHVCGNGQCIANDTAGNSTDSYTCDCDAGYLNFMNKSDGYCIHKCSIGADCTNANLPLGGAAHPPPLQPPPVSSSSSSSSSQSSSSQGQASDMQKLLMTAARFSISAALMLLA